MHTTIEPGDQLRIHHNGDWSGDVEVIFIQRDSNGESLRTWKVYGMCLIKGRITRDGFACTDGATVTHDVVARAVALASRTYLRGKMISFAENL